MGIDPARTFSDTRIGSAGFGAVMRRLVTSL
jgi:hypothetical protein